MADREAERAPNPVDVHVGQRIRQRRKALGVSQERLADQLGLTFQQVQKYERGANRVSASKLWEIARVLQTDLAAFFQGLGAAPAPGLQEAGAAFVHDPPPEAAELVALLGKLDRKRRRMLIDLARMLAEEPQGEGGAER